MRCSLLLSLTLLAFLPTVGSSQDGSASVDDRIRNARSAAPASIAENATVADFDGTVLRAGSNGWVCMPDNPKTPNNAPMCLDAPWREFMEAYMSRRAPSFTGIGFGYMLQEDFPVSNVDPFATAPTATNSWVVNGGPHIMMILSDTSLLKSLPTDPDNGGPWVMWAGTPYAHVMIPTVPRSQQ